MTTIREWLRELGERGGVPPGEFQWVVFPGTEALLRQEIATWSNRPFGLKVQELNFVTACRAADRKATAQTLIKDALLAAQGKGPILVTLAGTHILAAIYGADVLQPVFQHLRRGRTSLFQIKSRQLADVLMPSHPPKPAPSRQSCRPRTYLGKLSASC